MDDGGPLSGALSPEVAARFAAAEENEAGDTWEVAPHKETPTKSLGAKNLLALFDEPGKAAEEPPIPLEFQGEDLKAEQPAPRAASAYRPALALWALAGFTALTSAAAFMCGRRGGAKAVCGQRMVTVPRGRARRRVLLGDDDDAKGLVVAPPPARELFFHKVLRHQDPAMDPADADAVVAALQVRGGRLAEAASVPEAEREEALASFEKDYGAASRAHVLDVRAHVLGRVAGALDAQPDLDLVDAVEAGSAGKYEHAYERADVEGGPVATAGGFLLNLRAHVMRGADGLLHQNPAMDVEDVLAVKARTKQAKLAARGVGVRR